MSHNESLILLFPKPVSKHSVPMSCTLKQVEQPAKSVAMAEVEALPRDSSIPTLRERAHITMRSSAAAMESSQRAAAYSAAASSASSRAAEAAEQAAAAAASIQVGRVEGLGWWGPGQACVGHGNILLLLGCCV